MSNRISTMRRAQSGSPVRSMKCYAAVELAGDWWWDEDYFAATEHGKTLWESVGMESESKLVRLSRLDNVKLRAFVRYVKPETKMRLVAKPHNDALRDGGPTTPESK